MIDLPFYAHAGTDHTGSPRPGGKAFSNARGVARAGRRFFQEAGIDSLQTLEMLSRLENHFGIELPDYEVQGVSDFKTLAERIQSRL
jgi:acyl carrier protein